jgi:hypothetical protein
MKRGASFWKKLRLAAAYASGPAVLLSIAGVFLYFLLWFKLGSLTPGLSQSEATIQEHLALRDISFRSILDNPLYLPYSIILYVLQAIGLHGSTAIRGVSATLGSVTVVCFYLIIQRWHTQRLAVFGTLLFGTSSWFLHTARFGGTEILYCSVIAVLLTGIWLQQTRYRRLMLAFVMLATTFYLYVPGMIWFILITGIWQSKRLMGEVKRVPLWFNLAVGAAGLLLLFPLVWSVARQPGLLKPLFGLPETVPAVGQVLQNIINMPVHIFVSGPDDPEKWLPGTAYLDIFSGMMLFIGLYLSIFRLGLDRVRATFGVLLIGSILVALGGPISMALLIPFLYLLVTAGMTFMLQQWFTVFPRNPIARTIGTSLLSLAVLVTVFYHVNHYFIAWPNAPAVRQTYDNEPLIR